VRSETELRIAHLYRRAGFGLSPAELRAAAAKGIEACTEELLHPERTEDPLSAKLADLEGDLFDLTRIEDAQAWWLYRMIHTRRPLEEKMVLFWHGHFATAFPKVEDVNLLVRQNETLRANALGKFGKLLWEISRDPSMLLWLDNARSTKEKPNENYGRELLELFTLGIGNYGEEDVRAAARAFTGWKVREGEPLFDAKDHDGGPKTFLGETWAWTGEEIVAELARRESTADRLASKLVRFFVADEGMPELEADVARRYLETGGDIRETIGAILRSPHFHSESAIRARVKSPVEYVVGSIRELDAEIPVRLLPGPLARMGQALFLPPTVKGWDGGLAWINTSTLYERANFANLLVTQRSRRPDGRFEPSKWVGKEADGPGTVAVFLDALLDGRASPETRSAIETYLEGKDDKGNPVPFRPTPRALDEKVRGVVRLVLSSPEYQLA
jgi:uncharacterized protein (DUF1800 family)